MEACDRTTAGALHRCAAGRLVDRPHLAATRTGVDGRGGVALLAALATAVATGRWPSPAACEREQCLVGDGRSAASTPGRCTQPQAQAARHVARLSRRRC